MWGKRQGDELFSFPICSFTRIALGMKPNLSLPLLSLGTRALSQDRLSRDALKPITPLTEPAFVT